MSKAQQKRKNKKYQFFSELFSVFIAGSFSKTIIAPVERIKLLLQNQPLLINLEKNPYKGIVNAVKRVELEQGFFSFWRGNGVNIVRIIPNTAIRYLCFDYFNRIFLPQGNTEYNDFQRTLNRIASASLSGILTVATTYPLDLVRTRMALDITKHYETRQYQGTINCIKKIARAEGMLGLYKGFWVSCFGIVPFLSISLTTYDSLKPFVFDENLTESQSWMAQTVQYLGAGTVAGLTAQLITYPLDTIRRRMQLNGGSGLHKAYRSSFDCIKKITLTEGIRGFYKGLLPSLVKTPVAAAIQFPIYELFRYQFWEQ